MKNYSICLQFCKKTVKGNIRQVKTYHTVKLCIKTDNGRIIYKNKHLTYKLQEATQETDTFYAVASPGN